MEAKLIWSPTALDDLKAVSDYIGRDSPTYADQVVEAIVEAAEQLVTHPRMGWPVPELVADDLRQRVVHRYRLIYRLAPDRIDIVAVLHGAQDLPSALRSRR